MAAGQQRRRCFLEQQPDGSHSGHQRRRRLHPELVRYQPGRLPDLPHHSGQQRAGVKHARQLNGNKHYSATGITDNQLRTLNRLGLFNPAFDEAGITNFEQLSSVTNTNATLVRRADPTRTPTVRNAINPAAPAHHLRRPLQLSTPLTNQHIVNVMAAFSLGYDNAKIVAPSDIWRSVLYDRMDVVNPAIQMPPLARNLVDTNAVQVMADWINSLGGTPALAPPTLTPFGGIFTGSVSA